jgi:hypothetical protein
MAMDLSKLIKMNASGGRRSRVSRWMDSPPPQFAVEISPLRITVARRDPKGAAVVQQEERLLAPGAVRPSATDTNVPDTAAVSGPLRTMLNKIGGTGGEVILVIPDLAVRVSLLDFDHLPAKPAELETLVRFRLRKVLPFDAELAAVSFLRLNNQRVLAVVADRDRVEEYEKCVTEAGAQPTIVVSSTLAAIAGMPEFDHSMLLLKCDGASVTSAFAWNDALTFYRVIEVEAGVGLAFDDVFPSVAYYHDFLSQNSSDVAAQARVATCGIPPELRLRIQEDCPWAELKVIESTEDAGRLVSAGAFVNAL